MINKSCIFSMTVLLAVSAVCIGQNLEDDWNDFLHYTAIGRFDLAEGYGEKIVQSEPDALEMLSLSEDNPQGYALLVRLHSSEEPLAEVSGKILDLIEQGRFIRRKDPKIIAEEVRRLSSTLRGRYAAIERLQNAGEYAIPYMLGALADADRKKEFANVASALHEIGRDGIRPLAAAVQTQNLVVKAEIIKAMGKIGYPQSLGYLKYVAENDESSQLRQLALEAAGMIDSKAVGVSAAELFYQLGESYYYKAESLEPMTDGFGNMWFWDKQGGRLVREEVGIEYFNELMTMRACEWALRADPQTGKAIALWIAAFFRAEAAGLVHPEYFGEGHADAMTYATTAGAEYLHQALARAINDKDGDVALGVVEALAKNAGEASLMYRLKTDQPLMQALQFEDVKVRYSAAIAIASAGPAKKFAESRLVVENLSQAIAQKADERISQELTDEYAERAAAAMLKLANSKNKVIDLAVATETLVDATKDRRDNIKVASSQILARLASSQAQKAIADMALSEDNSDQIRIAAFESLAVSAKAGGNLLDDGSIDSIYEIVSSKTGDADLRSAAAAAYGALNLPSRKVKELVLDQAKS